MHKEEADRAAGPEHPARKGVAIARKKRSATLYEHTAYDTYL